MDAAAEGLRQLPAGTMLDGKYRIESLIAVGGMGAVYRGTHVKLRKRVAIKVLNPAISNPQMVERFHREAIIASEIGHEGIAQVTDLGTSADGEPFLVMEYLEGEPLSSRLRATGPMPVEIACELACAILSPLGAAHAAGIVHRDLKPDNVFLVQQSRGEMVKLLDFGISRAVAQDGEFRLTTTGLVLGTPYYMSPEQARGDSAITHAADIYAIGVILYEMLVGRIPIHADNYNQLMYRVMVGDFVHPRAHRPDVPAELEAVILSAMALQPADRPMNPAVFEQMLLPFCRATFRDHTIERLSAPRVASRTTPPPVGMKLDTGRNAIESDRTVLQSTPQPIASQLEPGGSTQARKPSRGVPIALGLVAVVGAVIAIVVLQGVDGETDKKVDTVATTEPTTNSPATNTAPDKPPATNTAPATNTVPENPPTTNTPPATTEQITVRFAVEPKTARITVDGKPVEGTELVTAKDNAEHEISVTASGHVTKIERIKFDMSQRLEYSLKPTKGPSRPTPPSDGKPKKPDRIDTTSPYGK